MDLAYSFPSPLASIILMVLLLSVLLVFYLFYPVLVGALSPPYCDGPSSKLPVEIVETVVTASSSSPLSYSFELPAQQQPLLSVVIPAYNEQDRLSGMLEPAYAYLSSSSSSSVKEGWRLCPALEHLREITAAEAGTMTKSVTPPVIATGPVVIVEWIVVSDGSTDRTLEVYRDFCLRCQQQSTQQQQQQQQEARQHSESSSYSSMKDPVVVIVHAFKYLALDPNRGKGGAVKAGILAATGLYRLMVDADGATRFSDLSKLTSSILPRPEEENDGATTAAVTAWGSRAHLQDQSDHKKKRSLPRQVLMHGFHAFVKLLGTRKGSTYVRDTQCGFKLFSQRAAVLLFSNLHLTGWAFDVELLILCSFFHFPVVEVPVEWREVDGSKLSTSPLNVAKVALSMLRDMICVRICYETGLWKIQQPPAASAKSSGATASSAQSSSTTAAGDASGSGDPVSAAHGGSLSSSPPRRDKSD